MNKDYVYKRRLLTLAAFLDKLPRDRFDFGNYVGYNWKGKEDLSCGTTACGMGWATTIPSFRKAGLRLVPHKYNHTTHSGGFVTLEKLKGQSYTYSSDYQAAKEVFGMDNNEYRNIFIPNCSHLSFDATPKMLAKHIRKFVKNKYGDGK